MLFAIGAYIAIFIACVFAQFPENLQFLNGYGYEIPQQNQNLQFTYLESEKDESPNGPFLNIRSKRGYPYRVIESQGLRSHFNFNKKPFLSDRNDLYNQNLEYTEDHAPPSSRSKRGADEPIVKLDDEEPLPVAEKQYSDQDFGKSDFTKYSRGLSSFTSDYSKSGDTDDDSLSEASINEGIKARAPRVHFVTQQKKNIEVAEARDRPTIAKPLENYRSNELYDARYPKYYDDYVPSNNRRYDLYPRKYDTR